MTDNTDATDADELTLHDAVNLAMRLHRAGDLDGAARVYRGVLDLAPDLPAALHFYGLLLDGRGDPRGLDLVRRSLDLSPDETGWWGNLAESLAAKGRDAEAEDAFMRGVALDPGDAAAYPRLERFLTARGRIPDVVRLYAEHVLASPQRRHVSELGRAAVRLGRMADGAAYFQRWLDEDPGNPVATHLLMAARGELPERAGDDYVAVAFDNYAERFDDHIASLDYRGPALIASALARACGPARAALDIVDAGCGTGLCGPGLRPHARRLVGVDLSQGMLDRAAKLGLYDDLARAELTGWLEALAPDSCDVVVSGDTLCYFGAIQDVLAAARRALREGGIVLFTLEAALSGDVTIDSSGRYQHSEAHVRAAAAGAGLAVEELRAEKLRDEGGRPLAGWLVCLRREAAAT